MAKLRTLLRSKMFWEEYIVLLVFGLVVTSTTQLVMSSVDIESFMWIILTMIIGSAVSSIIFLWTRSVYKKVNAPVKKSTRILTALNYTLWHLPLKELFIIKAHNDWDYAMQYCWKSIGIMFIAGLIFEDVNLFIRKLIRTCRDKTTPPENITE